MRTIPGQGSGEVEMADAKAVSSLLALIDIVRDDAKYRSMLRDLQRKMDALEAEKAAIEKAKSEHQEAAAQARKEIDAALDAHAAREQHVRSQETELAKRVAAQSQREQRFDAEQAAARESWANAKAAVEARSDNLDSRASKLSEREKAVWSRENALAAFEVELEKRDAVIQRHEDNLKRRQDAQKAAQEAIAKALEQ